MGRPNVGKSSLFNRLIREQVAITHHIGGSTRDLNKRALELKSCSVTLIDTGGLDLQYKSLSSKDGPLSHSISLKSYDVIKECDLIIYLVDGQQPFDALDVKIYRELSKKRPCLLVVNKIDNEDLFLNACSEFASFGVDFLCICVAHNRHINKLLNLIDEKIQF